MVWWDVTVSRCSSSPCLYIAFTSPSVSTQAHMHIQNKQANKHYPSSDTAQRASADHSANNNDSTWHNRITVKYSTSPQANYQKKCYKYQQKAKQCELHWRTNSNRLHLSPILKQTLNTWYWCLLACMVWHNWKHRGLKQSLNNTFNISLLNTDLSDCISSN